MRTVIKKNEQEKINPIYLSNELYLDLFLDWANANPELFDKKYPELSKGITRDLNSQPEMIAAMVEKLPQLFPIWLDKADKLIGAAKITELKNIVSILEKTINKEFNDEIIEHSRKKMIPIAKEYLDMVISFLEPEKEQSRNTIGFRRNEDQD